MEQGMFSLHQWQEGLRPSYQAGESLMWFLAMGWPHEQRAPMVSGGGSREGAVLAGREVHFRLPNG